MKKNVILATAVAFTLGAAFAAMADQPKTAEAPKAAQTAEATKPAPTAEATTPTTGTAPTAVQATATKPTSTTTPGTGTTATPATTTATKQEVTFKCSGVDANNWNTVKAGFAKADGVLNTNVDPMTGKVTCQIDQTRTNLDKLLAWAKDNKWNCTK